MPASDRTCLLMKLRELKKFAPFLGIESKLKELAVAISGMRPNSSFLFQGLVILNHKTDELLDQIWCWCERHGATGSISGASTGEYLINFFITLRFRCEIVPELNMVIKKYREMAESHDRREDQMNLFKKRATDPNHGDEENLIGRDEDVDNILALMYSRSRDYWHEDRRRAIRRRLFESTNNDDKRKLKDILTRRWRYKRIRTLDVDGDRQAWRFLSIIPIVGTLGIGKTAVARMVFHHAADLFDERVWVHVGPSFDGTSVLREFANRCQHQQEDEEAEQQERDIMITLASRLRKKRFLLVLDDFWNEDQEEWGGLIWQLLRVSRASEMIGNVVIVTTRSHELNRDCYELQALSADDSRRLLSRSLPSFAEHDHGHDDQQLGNVVNILLERCSGVPLAIKALAEYISSCKSREQDLDPNFRFTSTSNPELVESFSLSYELLFPLYWRNFLQFCTLFPEDHIYDMEEFRDIYFAESPFLVRLQFRRYPLHFLEGIPDFANLWKECFKKLESSSSSGKVAYNLCPLFRDLSLHVSELMKMDMSRSVRHLPLLVNSETSAFPRPDDLPKALTTFIPVREAQMVLSGQRCKIPAIPKDSLARLDQLRVLDLQCTMIQKLPRAIGKLLNLRYLNLSETDVRNLPRSIGKLRSLRFLKLKNCKHLRKLNDAVTKLVELQKLDLSGCWFLAEVPWNMESMDQLRCLNIKDCPLLDRMPKYSRFLRTLPRFIVGNALSICEGISSHLEGELRFENLEKVTDKDQGSMQFLRNIGMIESLTLEWKSNDAERTQELVLEQSRPTKKLIKLEIISYAGGRFPSWMSGPRLISLEEIRLFNLKGCPMLPLLGGLSRLRIAEISGMDAVTQVDKEFYGVRGDTAFPCLQKLTFSHMLKLERWLDVNGTRNKFPCLRNLTIINCPKLVALEMELRSVAELTLWLNNEGLYISEGGLKGLAPTLKKLSISLCQNLSESSECEGFFKDLGALEELEICGCRELTNLPGGVKHLKSIKSLTIACCDKLAALPNWLEDELPSLHSLSVSGCHLLQAIPEGLRQRPRLHKCLEGRLRPGAPEISDSQMDSEMSSNFRGKEAFPADAGCSEHGAAESPMPKLSSIVGTVDALLVDVDASSSESDISDVDLEF